MEKQYLDYESLKHFKGKLREESNIFTGTLEEWEALTEEEQAKYDFIASPDGENVTDPIYIKTITGTSTRLGNIATGLDAMDGYYVLSIWANDDASSGDQYSAFPLTDNNTQRRHIYAHCVGLDGTLYANKSVDLTIVYKRFTKTTTEN